MVTGLHHITLGCSDAARTVAFYTRVLGLRLVKKTVNFDDPTSYHLYFGDARGTPGSVVTFFEWAGAPRGAPGIGGTHHFALQVPDGSVLRKWKRYLTDRGVAVKGPLDRHYFESLYFEDPDGATIELATQGPGWTIDEPADALGQSYRAPPSEMLTTNRDRARVTADTYPEEVPERTPDMALRFGMHHITAIASDIGRTHAFLGELLGLELVKRTANFDDPESAHLYWGVSGGRPGTLVTYFERDPRREPRARMGAGQTHHYALAVPDDETQGVFRERLLAAGYRVSPVMDRVYFKSIYTQDPDGHIVELATAGPGFTVDEDEHALGTGLMLPPWLEAERGRLEPYLQPLEAPLWDPQVVG
ncbi:VOC family protein [Truepera radiovictrix]|uniref:Glyoxalase/bleomycin resistance protein/dioxygenase n=1 Tax=Truepera radiovictrix (strain DSM 17093 / CIP 108686 / LMG 22925 / RQ-24) TaxID=649638 RepID=D7CUH1_TRURR|nr:VOC family protein [Truepera radiovictrix]ADI15756.1 Glyoxalase/bleomycin resistance protein/dioxygenase [Truepera radiovictrix DSM 17093]WMT58617.1 VOC family protein [Truepera radiovictrix]